MNTTFILKHIISVQKFQDNIHAGGYSEDKKIFTKIYKNSLQLLLYTKKLI